METRNATLVLVDEQNLFLESLSLMMRTLPQISILATFTRCTEAYEFIRRTPPDLIITDIEVSGMDGFELSKRVKNLGLPSRLMFLSMLHDKEAREKAIRFGACALVHKGVAFKELSATIRSVVSGGSYFLDGSPDSPSNRAETELTPREREVLQLIAAQFSSKEIASKLFISLSTVETHRKNIFVKMGVRNVAGLIRKAAERAWV